MWPPSLPILVSSHVLSPPWKRAGKLDILLTDIVNAWLARPRTRAASYQRASRSAGHLYVYMSGYAEGLQESALPENAVFLQKPFRFATLLERLKLIRRRP